MITVLQWAKEEGWAEIIIASDCKQIVEEINSYEETRDHLTRMINLCRIFLGQLRGTVMFERREANAPADEIAKQARLENRNLFRFECILIPSPCCMKLIEQDIAVEPVTRNSYDSHCRHSPHMGDRTLT